MHSVHMLETGENAPAARLQRLAGDAVVAVWETQGGSAAERVVPVVDGEPVRRPYTTLTVRTGWGGSRHIAVFRWRTGSLLQLVGTADAVMAEARVQTDDPLDPFDPTLLLADRAPAARVLVVRRGPAFCRPSFLLSGYTQFNSEGGRVGEAAVRA